MIGSKRSIPSPPTWSGWRPMRRSPSIPSSRARRSARTIASCIRWLTPLLGAAALGSCTRTHSQHGRPFRRPPAPGRRLLVLAPHPDDEALGAAGLVEVAVRSGAQVHVVVATDGEAGPDRTGVPDLAGARRAETRRALAALGLGPDAVVFLGYADGSLAGSWTEAWTARPRGMEPTSAGVIVDALRAALRNAAPDMVIAPMALDAHPDHRALNRFALLALLGEHAKGHWPHVLGYLIHATGWPADPGDFLRASCPGSLFLWTGVPLGRDAVLRKAALIGDYRTQIGHTRRLLRFARPMEPFAREDVIRAPAAMAPTRPGVHVTAGVVVIHVPRGPCVAHPEAGDRLRLRYFDAAGVEERVVSLGPTLLVRGGKPGGPLAPAGDLSVKLTPGSARLELVANTFGEVGGGVLELLPADDRRIGPAWVLAW